MSTCDRAEVLRDYAFDELSAAEVRGIEQHLETCQACAADLDRLRITTAALRSISDREIPQRIAFVSDKVFAPSAAARFFSGFWNSAARLGFASACVLGTALIVSAYHRTPPPAEVRTVVQTADVSKQVDEAVGKVVAKVRDGVRQEDARLTQVAVDAAEARHEREHRALLDAFQVLQKRLNTNTLLASADVPSGVVGAMKTLLLISVATLCFAASEPVVSVASLKTVEASINDRMRSNINDPYDLLGPARGTYLEGYGAVFTVEMNLVLVSPLMVSPFKQTISDKELSDLHERKAKKVDGLKVIMRDIMTAASKSLPGLPPQERIVMEAFLFNYRWENSRGLPHRLVLTTTKQQLIDASNRHSTPTEMAALFTEEEL